MLDQSMLDSLKGIFAQLTGNYTLSAATTNDKNDNDLSKCAVRWFRYRSISEQKYILRID